MRPCGHYFDDTQGEEGSGGGRFLDVLLEPATKRMMGFEPTTFCMASGPS